MKGYSVYHSIQQLKEHPNPRTYEAVPELPMGKQVQVDFGELNLKRPTGSTVKIYAAAFLLSHSSYVASQADEIIKINRRS